MGERRTDPHPPNRPANGLTPAFLEGKQSTEPSGIFTESAHWGDSVSKSRCPPVCLSAPLAVQPLNDRGRSRSTIERLRVKLFNQMIADTLA